MNKSISDYKRLVKFVMPHWWVLTLAGICMIVSSAFSSVSISMLIPLIDNVIGGKKIILSGNIPAPPILRNLIDTVNAMPPMELLNRMTLIVMVLWFLKSFFEFWQTYFMRDVSERVIRDVKNILYKKILTLSLDYFSQHSTGKLMSRITYDAAVIRDCISTGLTDLLYQPAQLVFYTMLLLATKFFFAIPWSMIFISVGLFLLVIYPVVTIGKRLKAISRQSQDKVADITTTLHETISGIRVVKAFSMEPYETEKFANQNQSFYKLCMKSIKRMIVVSPITEFIGMVCMVIISWMAGKEILNGSLSAGAFFTFLASIMSLMRPIKRLTNVYSINQQALAAAERIFEVLDAKSSVAEKVPALHIPKISRKVELKDVFFKYEEKEILKGVTLEVDVGEIAAFVGPSGVGKTTLVNLIPRFYDASRGSVIIDGHDVRDCSLKSLRGQIGIVTQETILFNDTVAANIAYGSRNVKVDDIMKAAQIANAHSFIMGMPKGYDTIIGERGFKISGGEKQRLAIARAVFKDPPILILDEATSQLDTQSEILVQEAIDRMMKGRTVFVIAHRLSTIKHATKIYVLNDGRVAEIGSHDELLVKNGLYKRLYEMQFHESIVK